MNLSETLHECLQSRYSFGIAIPDGRLYLSWGNDLTSPRDPQEKINLQIQQFFSSKTVADLPQGAKLSLENSESFDWNNSYPGAGPIKGKKVGRLPDESQWKTFCEKIQSGFNEKAFSKVVPSRSEQWKLEDKNPISLLENLFSKKDEKTYRFFLWLEDRLFFGASPELLLLKKQEDFFVPCIAGTYAFDPKNPPDESARKKFLADPKERSEHLAVVRGIVENLESLGIKATDLPSPSLLELKGLLHLYTPIRFQSSSASVPQLISALHPTPAVGGYPQKTSYKFLEEHEPWNRGLFASPMYFQIHDSSHVVVAIRSGLYKNGNLSFFAGAGYVAESTPEKEWEETEKKMFFLKNLLELQNAE